MTAATARKAVEPVAERIAPDPHLLRRVPRALHAQLAMLGERFCTQLDLLQDRRQPIAAQVDWRALDRARLHTAALIAQHAADGRRDRLVVDLNAGPHLHWEDPCDVHGVDEELAAFAADTQWLRRIAEGSAP